MKPTADSSHPTSGSFPEDPPVGMELTAMLEAVRYTKWIAESFEGCFEGRVAEVGAGIGTFSRTLLASGVSGIDALEPDPLLFHHLAALARQEPRITAHQGTAREVLPRLGHAPDTVFYVNVLEHIREDRRELDFVFSILPSGGRLCVFVPALPCLFSEFDRSLGHWRRYRKSTLQSLAHAAGFRIDRLHYFDMPGALAWWLIFRCLGRISHQEGSVGFYDRTVVPVTRAVERTVRPPFGKNLVLVAVKP